MWTIKRLNLSWVPGATAYMSDGLAVVDVARGGYGSCDRLMISRQGSIDIVDCGPQPGGPEANLLKIAGCDYWYGADGANIHMTILPRGQCTVNSERNAFTVNMTPFPSIAPADLEVVRGMIEAGLIPYPDLLPGCRPYKDVVAVAKDFFAWSADAETLGLTIYDWTTADFFRMDIFNFYQYTMAQDQPLDATGIVNAIWTSDWDPYSPHNAAFMGSMQMKPAESEAEVASQYAAVAAELKHRLDALKRVTTAVLTAMPRTSVLAVPMLYSGQVDVSNLGETAFVTYFQEYPGNAGPPPAPMGEPLEQALTGFLKPGSAVTLKSFMSTTNSQNDAIKYSNGILLQVRPNSDSTVWDNSAYVTPLSNEATKTEYLFRPGARFVIENAAQETIDGKTITVVQMTAMP